MKKKILIMGIRGLTTYINNRSHLYLENFELHNTNLVIDGNGLASHLYKWHCKAHDCFTGDYDKYARVVKHFFTLLNECNVVSYVIFDGGYEKKKLATVASRMKHKIQTADRLNALTEGSESVFPLFLREVFADVILELGIKYARCEYEADTEISNLAKAMNCPVLSYDSDFYIYGCLYIPFNTVELNLKKGKSKSVEQKASYFYLPSKIYRIQKFLDSFGGLDQNNLPVLAVLLGNDYVKQSTFSPFFRNLKIQKCSGVQSEQQKKIKSVIVWLKNETPESAIKTVLNRFKSEKRKLIMNKIRKAMYGYVRFNTDLLNFFEIKVPNSNTGYVNLDEIEKELDKKDNDDILEKYPSDEEVQSESTTGSELEDLAEVIESEKMSEEYLLNDQNDHDTLFNDTKTAYLGPIFLGNFRKCLYPSCFMDMVILNKYYCVPQCEETSLNYSHEISLELISIIFKILTNNDKNLMVITRYKRSIKSFQLPEYNLPLPNLEEISKCELCVRKSYLLKFLNIDIKFHEQVLIFPEEWHLFLYSMKYALSKSNFDLAIVYSIIFCFLILNYIDPKIGLYRSRKAFDKKYAAQIKNSNKITISNSNKCAFEISLHECIIFMDKVVSYFQMDAKLQINHKLYEKTLVHSLAQIQSCFLHIKYLNCLLGLPFPNLTMHTIFDGTFIYNMTLNFRKRNNIKNYIDIFLKDIPNIILEIENVVSILNVQYEQVESLQHKKVRRKRKKKVVIEYEKQNNENSGTDSEENESVDPNNFFSVLSVI